MNEIEHNKIHTINYIQNKKKSKKSGRKLLILSEDCEEIIIWQKKQ